MKLGLTLVLFSGLTIAAADSAQELRRLVQQAQRAEQQNQLDDAISLYQQILRIRPGWASAELNLGLVYHSHADYPNAIRVLSQALQHAPELHSARLFRGASLYHTGRFQDAVHDLNEYLRHQPDDPDALALLANAYVSAGDPGQAAVAWAALARVSRDAAAYFQLSESFVEFGRRVLGRLSTEDAKAFRDA